MKRIIPLLLGLMLVAGAAVAQQILTSSPVYTANAPVGGNPSLVLNIAQFNEFNVLLIGNAQVSLATPVITGSLVFRINFCENATGGFTPTFVAALPFLSIVNNVSGAIVNTAANACTTQFWIYRSSINQIILQSVSPAPSSGGTVTSVSGANGVQVNNPTTTPQIVIPNSTYIVSSATPGSDFGAKVNYAVGQVGSESTIDASGLNNPTWSTTIQLGSSSQSLKLIMPTGIISRGSGVQLLLYNHDSVQCQPGSKILGNDTVLGAIAQGAASNVNLSQITVSDCQVDDTNSLNAGSVGFYFPALIFSNFYRDQSVNVDKGIEIGGTGTCACYNNFHSDNWDGQTYGVDIEITANYNNWYSEILSGLSSTPGAAAVHLVLGSGENGFHSPDMESGTYGLDFYGGNNVVDGDGYMALNNNIIFESGSNNNYVNVGGLLEVNSIIDHNTVAANNVFVSVGPNGGTAGMAPYYWAASQSFVFGGYMSGVAANYAAALTIVPRGLSNYPGGVIDFLYGTGAGTTFGKWGHAIIGTGGEITKGGVSAQGMISTGSMFASTGGVPSAPTLTVQGAVGTATCTYYVVCHDAGAWNVFAGLAPELQGTSLESSPATITNCPNTLSSSDFVQITPPTNTDGCMTWDYLTDSTHSIYKQTTGPVNDFGSSLTPRSAYTAPVRDTTGDIATPGLVSNGCAGQVALVSGSPSTATVSNSCLTASTNVVECTDQTNPSAIKCVASAGSLALTGPNSVTDTINWARLQ